MTFFFLLLCLNHAEQAVHGKRIYGQATYRQLAEASRGSTQRRQTVGCAGLDLGSDSCIRSPGTSPGVRVAEYTAWKDDAQRMNAKSADKLIS